MLRRAQNPERIRENLTGRRNRKSRVWETVDRCCRSASGLSLTGAVCRISCSLIRTILNLYPGTHATCKVYELKKYRQLKLSGLNFPPMKSLPVASAGALRMQLLAKKIEQSVQKPFLLRM